MIKILIRTSNFSKDFHASNRKKFFPTEKDLNPNYNFFENKFLKIFKNDDFNNYFKEINEISEKLNSNHDLDRKFLLKSIRVNSIQTTLNQIKLHTKLTQTSLYKF